MRFELAVEIARPPADVYAYIADPTHLPEWQGEVAEIRDATGDPLTAGSTFTEVRTFLGKRVESVLEVTASEPGASSRCGRCPARCRSRHGISSSRAARGRRSGSRAKPTPAGCSDPQARSSARPPSARPKRLRAAQGSPRVRPPTTPPDSRRTAVAAGLVVGCFLTWNVSNVGAVADPLAEAYGVSLAAVGLLTTGAPSSRTSRPSCRRGSGRTAPAPAGSARRVRGGGIGNAILLVDDAVGPAAAGRLVVGLGSGAGFVAGLDLVRAGGGAPLLQGVYGGATMAGGGLALMILPALTDATGWRAPYWTALGLGARCGDPGSRRERSQAGRPSRARRAPRSPPPPDRHPAGRDVRARRGRRQLGRDAPRTDGREPCRCGRPRRPRAARRDRDAPARRGDRASRAAAGAPARRGSLVAASGGAFLIAAGGPLWVSGVGTLALGLAAGCRSPRSSTRPSARGPTRPERQSRSSTRAPC